MSESIKIGACVYLMYNRPLDLYKIGYTTQMPEKRKAQIEAPNGNPWECPINLSVKGLILCETEEIAKYLESKLHQHGRQYGLSAEYGREWFTGLGELHKEAFFSNAGVWGWREILHLTETELRWANGAIRVITSSDTCIRLLASTLPYTPPLSKPN